MNRFIICTLLVSTGLCAQPARRITRVVSAASRASTIAPNSIATIYGENLTDRSESASGLPLPVQLAGILVVVNGPELSVGAQIISATPTQITFVVPPNTSRGTNTVAVVGPEIIFATTTVTVDAIAPGLFSANGTGSGPAAVVGARMLIPTGLTSPVNLFACEIAAVACHTVPVGVGVDTRVMLQFPATGIRGGSNITATIGGVPVPVHFAGAQPGYPGLDQVNVPLLLNLRGAGLVDVVVTVDGKVSNAVQIAVQ